MRSMKLITILAASLLITSTDVLIPDTLAQTKRQEYTAQEKDYPIIIQPTSVLPADLLSIAEYDKRFENTVEGSVHIVSFNLKPLKGELVRLRKVQLWLGYDTGYVTVRLDRREQGFGGTIHWGGDILHHSGWINLGIDSQDKLLGTVYIDGREFKIRALRDTSLHVVYEVDYSKFPGFHCKELKQTAESRNEQIRKLKRKFNLPPDFEFPAEKKRSPKPGEK